MFGIHEFCKFFTSSFAENQSDSHQGSFSVPVTSNSTYRSSPSNPDSMSFHRALSSASDILSSQGPSSMETLLTNIQGLLKVAADNARQQEKHNHLQSAELKLELLREKELRESLGKQLAAEQKRAAILLKRLKKEKKARRRLAEQIGVESTTHVENGEVPSTPTEPVTKVNGDSQRLKNEAFQDSEPKKHEKVDQDSNYEVSMTSEKASLLKDINRCIFLWVTSTVKGQRTNLTKTDFVKVRHSTYNHIREELRCDWSI
ncbi:putative dachshund-like 1 isoform X4 [Apostichopus japonicus]|uniref:Putative dachshund-like 1 isoform X4 n=1 Tax=Stichopus japonicus TaxID=307972 RepID=A0A2G8JUF3_STIJA|nr:putative dachshund-like 1 isoform X4 [Apostichopus japonicus]